MLRRALAVCWAPLLGACAHPILAKDGTLVFQEKGAHGAAIITAEGVEFHDVAEVPTRIVSRDPYEPWRAPIGFIVPKNGRFMRTSQPTRLATTGLAITLRPSDTRVPAWGGEMLVRVDVLAPAAPGEARWGEDVAIVLDGRGEDTRALCDAALAQLGGRDRVLVLDAAGGKVVVPVMPASNRSLVSAAVGRHLETRPSGPVRRKQAVEQALGLLTGGTLRRVLFLSDAPKSPRAEAEEGLGSAMVPLDVVRTQGKEALEARVREVQDFVPAAGRVAFRNVILTFDASPAPSHVLEASGGDARWEVEGGDLALGDVRAGDERAEVVRLTVPAWTAGESYSLHVTAHFDDLARGEPSTMSADLRCTYDSDIERIAESRNGDVIAYASALATVARLDAAFTGQGAHEDLRPVALLHARSLALLARDMHDPAAAAQAAMLEALVDVVQ